MPKHLYLSVVVPVYNEEGNLSVLDRELKVVLSKITPEFEILYINDGSTDNSLRELRSCHGVTIINLNRNYGQAVALDAGFKAAAGDIIISIDGDGQNDPHDIPLLLQKLKEEHLDVVAGWRKSRRDRAQIRILTRVGRALRRMLINDSVHDSGCTLRVYTREAVQSLDIGGEMHRYILALLKWKGFRIGEAVVNDRPRKNGVSKYGSGKAVRGFIDLVYVWFIYKYSQRPLHLFGYLSMASSFLGILAALWTLYNYLLLGIHFARDVWLIVSCFFLLSAMLFWSFGLVIDLLIRIQLTLSPHEKRYYIREVIRT